MIDWRSILEKSNQPEIVKLPDNLKQGMTIEDWVLYRGHPIPESSYISKDGFVHVGGEDDKLRILMQGNQVGR